MRKGRDVGLGGTLTTPETSTNDVKGGAAAAPFGEPGVAVVAVPAAPSAISMLEKVTGAACEDADWPMLDLGTLRYHLKQKLSI